MIRLSIVTINFNNSVGLSKTISSMKAQSVDRENFEYIVVDGFSVDGSVELLNTDMMFIDKLIIEKDRGIFDAMNKGVKVATGDYIYFLNSGDVFSSDDVLQNIINELDICQPNILLGKVNTFYNNKFLREADLTPWICHQAAFVSTPLMKMYMFDDSLRVFGDLDLWFRMNKNSDYKLKTCNILIANMEMDGIGNDPKFYKIRAKDKSAFNKKHNLKQRALIDAFTTRLQYYVAKFFGYKFYHGAFLEYYAKVRKLSG